MSRFGKQMLFTSLTLIAMLCSIQVMVYSDSEEFGGADIFKMAATKINEILENPNNHIGKKRLIIGTIERKIEERHEAGVSFYRLKDDFGGEIEVKSLDEKLPEEFVSHKYMVIGTVEKDALSDDPAKVYFHENKRKLYGPSAQVESPVTPELPKKPEPPETHDQQISNVQQPPIRDREWIPIPLFVIILGSLAITCAAVGLGFFIWSLVRKPEVKKQETTRIWGTDATSPPPITSTQGTPTIIKKDKEQPPTMVRIDHGYLGRLSGDGQEVERVNLYKHGNVNDNGEYVFVLSRAIHNDEHRTIKFPDNDEFVTRKIHAKLFVHKTTGEFRLEQIFDENPIVVSRSKGGDSVKLKPGNPPVILEDKDVITVGMTKLVLHKTV